MTDFSYTTHLLDSWTDTDKETERRGEEKKESRIGFTNTVKYKFTTYGDDTNALSWRKAKQISIFIYGRYLHIFVHQNGTHNTAIT